MTQDLIMRSPIYDHTTSPRELPLLPWKQTTDYHSNKLPSFCFQSIGIIKLVRIIDNEVKLLLE